MPASRQLELSSAPLETAPSPGRRKGDWQILVHTIAVGGLTVLVKAVGAGKAIVIAHSFGAGRALDAYLIAFLVPSFLCDVLAGALNLSLVPMLIEARQHGSRADIASVYARALHRSFALLAAVAAVVLAGGITWNALAGTKTSFDSTLALKLFLLMLPMLPLSAVANVWRSALNSEKRFTAAAISPVLTPAVTICFLFLKGHAWGVYALAAGTTIGMAAETALLALALRATDFPVFPRRVRGSGPVDPIGRQYRAIAASNLVMSGSMLIDQTMAATLGAGGVSILNFGTRFSAVLAAVGPAALSTTILPTLSEMAARRQWAALRRSVVKYLGVSIGIAVPVTAVLVWYSEPIVRVAFERGAFTASDTRIVAAVQACSLLCFPLSIGIAVLTRLIASLKVNQILVPLSIGTLVANAGLDYLFMLRYGVVGIAVSTVIVRALMLAVLVAIMLRRTKDATLDRN